FVVALYIAMPVAIMADRRAPDLVFFTLMAASLVLVAGQGRTETHAILRRYRVLLFCFLVPTVAVLVSMLAHGHWSGTDFQRALRLTVGLPVLLLALDYICRIKPVWLGYCLWGIYPAALGASARVV